MDMASKGGAKAAIHIARVFVIVKGPFRVIIEFDFHNAYNLIRRNFMLEKVKPKTPILFLVVRQSYKNSTPVLEST